MLVVLASRADAAARMLCERAPPGTARVLTWRDLSTPGWRYYGDSCDGTDAAVSGGSRLASSEITAVVTRCPYVPPYELGHVVPGDRGYVAAEMTAFLLAWLTRLRCPVLNRPQNGCLCGPQWAPERWTMLATSLGLPAVPVERRTVPGLAPGGPGCIDQPGADTRTVTVVGSRAIADDPQGTLADDALRLARAAGLALARIEFAVHDDKRLFLSAHLDADLAAPAVADALLEHVGLETASPAQTAAP